MRRLALRGKDLRLLEGGIAFCGQPLRIVLPWDLGRVGRSRSGHGRRNRC